jgi:hypothetical protein
MKNNDMTTQHTANAELLLALQNLIRCVPQDKCNYEDTADWEDALDAIEQAEAAIAKATEVK